MNFQKVFFKYKNRTNKRELLQQASAFFIRRTASATVGGREDEIDSL